MLAFYYGCFLIIGESIYHFFNIECGERGLYDKADCIKHENNKKARNTKINVGKTADPVDCYSKDTVYRDAAFNDVLSILIKAVQSSMDVQL